MLGTDALSTPIKRSKRKPSALSTIGEWASVAGPAAGLAGAGLSYLGERQGAKEAEEAVRPKRRRLTKLAEWGREQEQRRASALASLGQAATDFAFRLR